MIKLNENYNYSVLHTFMTYQICVFFPCLVAGLPKGMWVEVECHEWSLGLVLGLPLYPQESLLPLTHTPHPRGQRSFM